jgi:amidase
MRTVSSKDCIYAFAAQMEPVCWVKPGEVFRVEMRDALDGQVTPDLALPRDDGGTALDGLDQVNVNPATGPVGVSGARPGQTLAVDILDIAVAPHGYVTYGGRPRFFSHAGGLLEFNSAIRLPLRPMIGTIGVAPAQSCVSNRLPGDHGGNMDIKDVCAGATLYLPVSQPGALLAMGDAHSIQADGESSGQGVETSAAATVRARLLERRLSEVPVLFFRGELMTIGHGETLDVAARRAVSAMAQIIVANSSLAASDARVLIGLAGDVRVGQMVNGLRTARVALPVAVVPWARPPAR